MHLEKEKVELIKLHNERKIAIKEEKEWLKHFHKRMIYFLSFFGSLYLIITFNMFFMDDEWDFLLPIIAFFFIIINLIAIYIYIKRDRINFPVYFNFNSKRFNELLEKIMIEIDRDMFTEDLATHISPNYDNITVEITNGGK